MVLPYMLTSWPRATSKPNELLSFRATPAFGGPKHKPQLEQLRTPLHVLGTIHENDRKYIATTPTARGCLKPKAMKYWIGGRIRLLRLTQEFTQDYLAGGSGITQGYLSKIEQGVRDPGFHLVLRLAHILNCPLVQLAEGEGPVKQVTLKMNPAPEPPPAAAPPKSTKPRRKV